MVMVEIKKLQNHKIMKQKMAVAYLNAVKSSPLKIMRVTRNIVGLSVSDASKSLHFSKLKASQVLKGLLYSAMSNAENNHGMDIDKLYIKEVDVGRAFALRRFAARGRGKSSGIRKTFSNIRITLEEKGDEQKVLKKTKKEE